MLSSFECLLRLREVIDRLRTDNDNVCVRVVQEVGNIVEDFNARMILRSIVVFRWMSLADRLHLQSRRELDVWDVKDFCG